MVSGNPQASDLVTSHWDIRVGKARDLICATQLRITLLWMDKWVNKDPNIPPKKGNRSIQPKWQCLASEEAKSKSNRNRKIPLKHFLTFIHSLRISHHEFWSYLSNPSPCNHPLPLQPSSQTKIKFKNQKPNPKKKQQQTTTTKEKSCHGSCSVIYWVTQYTL